MTNPLENPTANPFEIAREAAQLIAERTGVAKHDIALTLGSGWAKAADLIGETVASINAADIPGFSAPVVEGHVATIRSIALPNGKHALVLGARTHFYEGHGVRRVVHGVRTAAAAGASTMILTNGAGGIKTSWKPGTAVLISDHINLTAASPLEGATFIDLTEVQMVKHFGGHLVGMSTALEAIAAREAGMEVLGFSLMTNLAAGIQDTPLSHAEVLEAGREAESRISALLAEIITKL